MNSTDTEIKSSKSSDTLEKNGYKKTKLGWIPKEWSINKLKKVAKVIMGNSPKGASYNEKNEGTPLINGPTEFTNRFPEQKQWTTNPTKLCKRGDILLCIRGSSTGRINIADNEYCIGRGVAALRSSEENDQTYFEYQLHKQLPRLLKLTSGSTFPSIKSKDIRNLLMPTPSLPEQKEIANILSTWDLAIHKLEDLKTKKEKLKKGLMQRLLTVPKSKSAPNKRFSGYEEGWKEMRLDKVFEFLRSISVPRKSLGNSANGPLNIHYGDIHTKFNSVSRLNVSRSNKIPSIAESYSYPSNIDYAKDGDLIVVDASEDYEGVGECIELKDVGKKKITAGLHTFLLRDTNNLTVPGFRALIFEQHAVKKQLKQVVTGSKVFGLSKTNFTKIKISIPPKEEQRKIVQVLQNIESEIERIKSLKRHIDLQKKGLMQQLLTGKTRVNSNKQKHR